MRYLIIGAGAVGGTIGGLLAAAGKDVVLVARGPHLAALRKNGLRLELPRGDQELAIPAVAGPDELTPREDDLLVLAVKTQDTAAALDTWSGFGGRPPVVCAQNGVENERLALRRLPDVYGMCVWLPSSHLVPGVVQAPCAPLTGMLHVGRYPSGEDATARRIAADLSDAGFGAPVTREVMAWKYAKLISNLANAVEAVCGPAPEQPLAELALRARAEGTAVLDAAGIPYVSAELQDETRGQLMRPQPVKGRTRGGGSSWQSLQRGTGSIETDYLNGEIVMLGRRLGIPTPVNEALLHLANRFAHEHRRPGELTPEERESLLTTT